MHQEKVKIIKTQIIQRLLQRWANVVRVVLVVPELAGNEDLAPWHAALPDGLPNSFFGTIARYRVSFYIPKIYVAFIFTI